MQDKKSCFFKYIDQTGQYIIDEIFELADSFSEGYAKVKTKFNPYWIYIDVTGKKSDSYKKAGKFSQGLAVVGDESSIQIINKSFEVIRRVSRNVIPMMDYNYHNDLVMGNNGSCCGFVDKQLNLKIPFIFIRAENFSENIAVVSLGQNFIGLVNPEGKISAFAKTQYSQIRSFHEGLSAVKNDKGLWGYINKECEEVIPCQYKEADDFSEGLAGVVDTNGICHYIDKRGNKKITIGDTYYSMLELSDKTIYIIADSEEELKAKKLQVLDIAKQELVEKTIDMIDQLAYDTTAGLYQQSKSKVKKPSRQKPDVGAQPK